MGFAAGFQAGSQAVERALKRYINGSGRRFMGVMAQDVVESHPDMVFTMPDGFMAVNYAGLGIEMVEV